MLNSSTIDLKSKMRLTYTICFRATIFVSFILYTICTLYPMTPALDNRVLSSSRHLLRDCPDRLVEDLNNNTGVRIPDAFNADQLRGGAIVFYVLGIGYMFIALSVVCDECFVPALEEATSALKCPSDVAGATLMAAGGSAPELMTSFIGTFQESDVGFGTIVGSAVFNILFVIGMCVIKSSVVLKLTWYPLFRDCFVYALSLFVLAFFFLVTSPKKIQWWEAFVLLLMYVGYVVLMKYNKQLEAALNGLRGKKESGVELKEPSTDSDEDNNDDPGHLTGRLRDHRPTIYNMVIGNSLIDTAEIQVVRKIQGNCDQTFESLDTDKSGYIDHLEFSNLLKGITPTPSDDDIKNAIALLDDNNDGKISKEEFTAWYTVSKERVYKDLETQFDKLSSEGRLPVTDVCKLLNKIDHAEYADDDDMVKDAIDKLDSNKDGYVTREEFQNWYKNECLEKNVQKLSEQVDALEEGGLSLYPFPETIRGRIMYIILAPLVVPMYFTIPNVYKYPRCWPFSFLMSIVWVAIFSFFMVQWTTTFGYTIGIPIKVMGLIVLAAGTSIPDLLTSVCVAMNGKGDMAISSSIGSNIFDVLVGLPLPWLCYTIYHQKDVRVGKEKDNVGLSLIVLCAIIVLVISTIAAVGWEMNKKLGIAFFVLYALYITFELVYYYTIGPGSGGACL